LTLDHVAAAIGCARSRVAATFKSDLGEAMHRYVARVRIRRAAELIVQGDKIEAAMLAVGYRSKKNFYHQFKRETGETPAAYRDGIRTPGGGGSPRTVRSTTLAPTDVYETAAGVTIARASELLGVSRRTVYNWIKQGRLSATHQPNGARRIPLDSFCSAGPKTGVVGRPVARPEK
jgi:excisionase family DNA binding protein